MLFLGFHRPSQQQTVILFVHNLYILPLLLQNLLKITYSCLRVIRFDYLFQLLSFNQIYLL